MIYALGPPPLPKLRSTNYAETIRTTRKEKRTKWAERKQEKKKKSEVVLVVRGIGVNIRHVREVDSSLLRLLEQSGVSIPLSYILIVYYLGALERRAYWNEEVPSKKFNPRGLRL